MNSPCCESAKCGTLARAVGCVALFCLGAFASTSLLKGSILQVNERPTRHPAVPAASTSLKGSIVQVNERPTRHPAVPAASTSLKGSIVQVKEKPTQHPAVQAISEKQENFTQDLQDEAKCYISQYGRDGIGHQTEGKLSCMAMAEFVGLEYLHDPFVRMQHVGDEFKRAAFFEDFFGFGTQFRRLNKTKIGGHSRISWVNPPQVGHCGQDGWLRKLELGKIKCKKDDWTVVQSDNCWDRMYCHGYMKSGRFYELVPKLHAAYHSSPKPDPNWTQGLSGGNMTWGPKVAIHIRQGDSSYQLRVGWYAAQIDELRKRFQSTDPNHPPLFRIQTDAESPRKLLAAAPELNASDVVIDGRRSPLELAIHRMITADALIMSRSSLSMTVALIGNQSTVIHPDCHDRTSLPHWTRVSCKVQNKVTTTTAPATPTTPTAPTAPTRPFPSAIGSR